MRESYGKPCDWNVTAGLILKISPAVSFIGRDMPQQFDAIAPTASFLIRVWPEPGSATGWRGFVQHVQSGENSYFGDARKLLLFIARHGPARFEEQEARHGEDTNCSTTSETKRSDSS